VKVWEVFVVPNFQSSQAALVFILESFLMNIDVLFMIFLSQSACHFHFSYFKLSFTLFIIMSAAPCYAIMLFIFLLYSEHH
jgi:hypothetical protein